ncbi:uncharacterized protein LOC131210598 [Anopheles bellator]|uniref:uncharacterized protein LOC131210598 n=1 Tax=Anopheles bellator TaxID=139047 RepID=UPI0026471D5A|nr:uncharacterized protein LOC131210598 [Anopheles bellator]
MFMDDSGIESGDKLDSLFADELGSFVDDQPATNTAPTAVMGGIDSDAESDIFSKLNDFDVVFENPNERQTSATQIPVSPSAAPDYDGFTTGRQAYNASGRKVLSSDNSTDSYASSTVTPGGAVTVPSGSIADDSSTQLREHSATAQQSTCKILQRKLELKVERAKRNYKQMYHTEQEVHEKESQISSLIPISRLPIPGCRDSQQLVDVNTGFNSDDDLENVSFFPRPIPKASGSQTRQELSDTFSIQEMTIESDNDDLDFEQCRKLSDSKGYRKILNRGAGQDDYLDNDTLDEDDDSQNLELLAPKRGYVLRQQLRRLFCCCKTNEFL